MIPAMASKAYPANLAIFLVALCATITTPAQIIGTIPDDQPRYEKIQSVPGTILDFNSDVILYATYNETPAILNLATGSSEVLATNTTRRGFLTPGGALIFSQRIFQINGSEKIDLGEEAGAPVDFGDRVVEGRFGILRTTEGALLRDFEARTNRLLTTNPMVTADVAANGSVVFTTSVDGTNVVQRYHNGVMATLATLPAFPHPYVATDGTNVLWSEPESFSGWVQLQTPAGRVTLATNTAVTVNQNPRSQPRVSEVAMKNGWIVFPENPMTQKTLRRRSPTGEISQITTNFGYVLAMRDDGGTLVLGGDGRIETSIYYVPAVGATKRISQDFGAAMFVARGNKFYAYSISPNGGMDLFEVEVDEDPFGLLHARYEADSGMFSFVILAGAAGTYALERSDDLVEWTQVTTYVVTSTYPAPETIATPPGFFRLKRI
jgi:hypothetical protein